MQISFKYLIVDSQDYIRGSNSAIQRLSINMQLIYISVLTNSYFPDIYGHLFHHVHVAIPRGVKGNMATGNANCAS